MADLAQRHGIIAWQQGLFSIEESQRNRPLAKLPSAAISSVDVESNWGNWNSPAFHPKSSEAKSGETPLLYLYLSHSGPFCGP